MSDIRALAGAGPSGSPKGESSPFFSPNFDGLLALFGVPWFADASPQYLPSCSQELLPPCPNGPLFKRVTILTSVSTMALLPIKVTLRGPEGKGGAVHPRM